MAGEILLEVLFERLRDRQLEDLGFLYQVLLHGNTVLPAAWTGKGQALSEFCRTL